jgi:hypothetical protein
MTTNVYDLSVGILASDSRWSGDADGYLFYVDDVGYQKIVFDSKIAILFAGNLDIIDVWKKWFSGGRYGIVPQVNNYLSLCIVDLDTGAVRKDHGIKLMSPCNSARFAGTGSPHALQCWTENKDAIKSVQTACGLDMKSGGKVNFLNRTTKENNVNNSAMIDQVMSSFLQKGEMIMVNSDKKQIPIPIGDAINNDATAKAAFGKVMGGGSSSICAPFIGMGTPWTAEEQAELYSILSEYPPEPK